MLSAMTVLSNAVAAKTAAPKPSKFLAMRVGMRELLITNDWMDAAAAEADALRIPGQQDRRYPATTSGPSRIPEHFHRTVGYAPPHRGLKQSGLPDRCGQTVVLFPAAVIFDPLAFVA